MKPFIKINQCCLKERIVSHLSSVLIIVSVIFLIELGLAIWNPLFGSFSSSEKTLREVCYISLAAISLQAVIITSLYMKKKLSDKNVYYMLVILYEICLDIFATIISFYDIVSGVEGGTVFLTVIIAVPCVALINPYYYSALTAVLVVSLLTGLNFVGHVVIPAGTVFNYIFYVFAVVFISFSLYWFVLNSFMSSQKLTELSYKDQLTGLYNRRSLDNKISELAKNHPTFAFILSDIDNFKKVNDTLGHAFGDEVLKEAARIVKEKFGNETFRYGGDEIAIIANETPESIRQKIDSINSELRKFTDKEVITLSFGVYFSKPTDDVLTPFLCADKALYESKTQKGTMTIYKE